MITTVLPGEETLLNDELLQLALGRDQRTKAVGRGRRLALDRRGLLWFGGTSLLGAAYAILKDGQVYRDLGADYFTRNDRMRTVTKLTQRLRGRR